MKIIVMPKSKEELLSTLEFADAFLLGLDKLCINMPKKYSLDEIKELINIIQKNNKEVFIALNKNMHNSDIPYLKDMLNLFDSIKVDAILYYDIAVVNLKEDNNLSIPLIWGQEHMTTNYVSSNYWHKHGSNYTLISAEITIDEIEGIKDKAETELIVPIFGHISMFVSKRHLIKNYLNAFKIKDISKIHYMVKRDNAYPIIDDEDGTTVYSSHILNGIEELPKLNEMGIDYILLNSFNIDSNIFADVVKMFKEANIDNVKELSTKIDSQLLTNKGFLYSETIYKVKKDGK